MVIKKTGPVSFPTLPAATTGPGEDVPTDETTAVNQRAATAEVSGHASTSDQFASQSAQDAFAQSAIVDSHPAFEAARPSSVRRMGSVLERSLDQVSADFSKVSADISGIRDELFQNGFAPDVVGGRGGELGRLRRKARTLRMRQRQLGRRLKFLGADVPRSKLDSQIPTDARPLSRAMGLADAYGDAVAVRFEVDAGQKPVALGNVLAHQTPSAIVTEGALQELGVDVKSTRHTDQNVTTGTGPLAELLALNND